MFLILTFILNSIQLFFTFSFYSTFFILFVLECFFSVKWFGINARCYKAKNEK